jgi:hypothetical protein
MLTETQLISLKNIYSLFTNVCSDATEWCNKINIKDDVNNHIEKLTTIMNLITNDVQIYEGNIEEIIIIVEECLREYILEKFARESDEDTDTESDEESKFEQ